jgi:polysaccharide biosynthesis/export protein
MNLGMSGCAVLLLAVFFTGCQHPGPRFDPYEPEAAVPAEMQEVTRESQLQPEWLQPSTTPFTLGPGDQLELEIIGDPISRTMTAVGPDGKIYFYLLPGMDVWGLTLPETKALLERELGRFFVNQGEDDRMQISISLRAVESQRVWLLGRFQSPGLYPLEGPTTLLEAISMAGGTASLAGQQDLSSVNIAEEIADLNRSFIIRQGEILPVDFNRLLLHGDLSQNIYLQPDDFIYFPAATSKSVYIMGAVASPRAIPYNQNLTVVGAVAYASGTIRDGYLSHVAIVRGTLTEPKIAIVDYKAIITGKIPDVGLEPRDIVYVPFRPYRYLTRYADIILRTFATSVAINEGARAVLDHQPASPAGVVIPFGSQIIVTPSSPIITR